MADHADERTPLIAVVRVQQPLQRRGYTHSTVRRCCTIGLSVILLLGIVVALILMFVVPDCEDLRRHNHRHSKICLSKHPFFRHHNYGSFATVTSGDGLSYDDLLDTLVDTPDEKHAEKWSSYYTSGNHLAGLNKSQAEWTRDRWEEFGVSSEIVAYDIYVNYPLGHRLALLENEGEKAEVNEEKSEWKVKYEANLTEDVLKEDRTSGLTGRIPTFHGCEAPRTQTFGMI
jgi:N-acetylated-alpha-linked acidic dipeptidase